MKYFYKNSTNKVSIDSKKVFIDALEGKSPLSITDFPKFFTKCEQLVLSEKKPTDGALSNVRGNWYEWLISFAALEYVSKRDDLDFVLLPLPTIRSFDYMALYKPEIYHYIEDLKQKTVLHDVSLISSNPDYAIIRTKDEIELPIFDQLNVGDIDNIDAMYKKFKGVVDFKDLIGFASVKTSLRPDRRLQLSHEGALVKSFFEHLKTRLWEIDAIGPKYIAVSMDFGEADVNALKTVATHSILAVNSKPERAVDIICKVSGCNDLDGFLTLAFAQK